MNHRKEKQQSACVVRLDRFTVTATGSSEVPREIGEFKISRDFRPRERGKIGTYERVRTFCSTSNSARLSLRYKPLLPWLRPYQFTLVADDHDGITPDQVESVIAQCASHRPSMAELAFDFRRGSVVNRQVVLQHAKFGKSQRGSDRGGGTNLRYGSRKSPKLVRVYDKEAVDCFRIELEIHSPLLRKYRIGTGFELARLAGMLHPAHIQFVGYRWEKLEGYLIRRFGEQKGTSILREARDRADSSLQAATRFLSECGVPNPHRFQSHYGSIFACKRRFNSGRRSSL